MIQSLQMLETSVHVIIEIVPAQFFLEFIHAGVLVDQEELGPGHLGKITQMVSGDRVAKACVVRAAGMDPGRGGNLEVRTRQPQGTRHRQMGERLIGRDHIYNIRHNAEAVPPCP